MPSVKFDVDVSSFKNGISSAKDEVRTLNQQMKMIDATFKATGNSEQAMAQKTETLNNKMTAQKAIADQAKQALDAMTQKGINPASESYQKMARELLSAQTGMMETQAALNELSNGAVQAASSTSKLEKGLNGISKKISLDQVIGAVDKLAGGLEKAEQKAVAVGKKLWENIVDTARYSDDIVTSATNLNMTVEQYQQYKGVFDTVGEITVQEWMKAKQKVQKVINDPTNEQTEILDLLGIKTHEGAQGKLGYVEDAARDFEDVFWDIGETLKRKVERGEMTQDLADTYANALFGRGFAGLNSMFGMGREGFNKELNNQAVASEEAAKKNAELNDSLIKLQNSYDALKMEVTAGIAPALTGASEALNGLIGSLLEYLNTPEGKQALADMEKAVSGLFTDLSNIDPQQVVEGFTGVFDKVVGGLQWLETNSGTVITAMEAIVAGWGALQLAGAALDILKLIEGIKGLGGAAAADGAAAGASWGAAFAGAVMKAAPWLIGLYTLLNPTEGGDKLGNNTLVDENGVLTKEAERYGYGQDANGELYYDRTVLINEAAQKAWDLYRAGTFNEESAKELRRAFYNDEEMMSLFHKIMDFRSEHPDWLNIEDIDLTEWLEGFKPEITVEPVAEAGANEKLTEEIGTVYVPTVYVPTNGDSVQKIRTPQSQGHLPGYANGIWYVPDTRLAWIHQGEKIVSARQVAQNNRSFTSNTYFENVNINNGMDAEGLAARVAAEQRRTADSFGG